MDWTTREQPCTCSKADTNEVGRNERTNIHYSSVHTRGSKEGEERELETRRGEEETSMEARQDRTRGEEKEIVWKGKTKSKRGEERRDVEMTRVELKGWEE